MENTKNQSIFKTFLAYSIPCIIGMFLTSFIIIVDGIFIGRKMGENGLAAINLTLPVLYILLAVTIMIGVGGVTLAAQSLGEKNKSRANHFFTFAFISSAVFNLVVMAILFLFQDGIVALLNAKGILTGYVRDYLGIMKYFYLFMMLNMIFTMFIRSEGKPQLSLLFGLFGNILNIILDYLLIMKFNYGMKGAAIASGLSVLIPFILGILYFLSKHSVYKFQRIHFAINDLQKMLFYGLAEFMAQISVSITTYILNWVLLRRIGINGVAALTIVGYVSFIQNMIVSGIAVGIHPLISYHFGAQNRNFILDLLSIAMKAVVIVGIGIFLIVLLISGGLVKIFSKDNLELIKVAGLGLKLYSISFIISGFNIIAAAYFTSLGEAKQAAIVSILRSLVLVIIFILILPYIIGDTGIWLAGPVTEAITFILAYMWIKRSKIALQAV